MKPNRLCGQTKNPLRPLYRPLKTPDGTSLTYNPQVYRKQRIRLGKTVRRLIYDSREPQYLLVIHIYIYLHQFSLIGFYRVNYEVDNWMALIKQLNNTPTDIHVLNRAQLISDSFNLARAGQLNYTVALELTKYLKNENSITPWYSAMNGFSYLLQRMPRSEKGYKNLKVKTLFKYRRIITIRLLYHGKQFPRAR